MQRARRRPNLSLEWRCEVCLGAIGTFSVMTPSLFCARRERWTCWPVSSR
jgi:hypothetical protein